MEKPAYVHYTDPAFQPEFLADMTRPCVIPGATDGHLRLAYDPDDYDFRTLVAAFLRTRDIIGTDSQQATVSRQLEHLHQHVAAEHQLLDNTQHNAVAVALYDLQGAFTALYKRFIAEVIVPGLGLGPAHWQKQPTFRVFFPNSQGYPGKTTYHSDLMLGHNPREINVFLPFTSCQGSRSLLMAPLSASMGLYEKYDYDFAAFADAVQNDDGLQKTCAAICQPLTMDVGEVLVFDSRCLHAGPPNETDLTRVTVDFRLLMENDIAQQANDYRGTGRTKALFAPGGAFSAETLSGGVLAAAD